MPLKNIGSIPLIHSTSAKGKFYSSEIILTAGGNTIISFLTAAGNQSILTGSTN